MKHIITVSVVAGLAFFCGCEKKTEQEHIHASKKPGCAKPCPPSQPCEQSQKVPAPAVQQKPAKLSCPAGEPTKACTPHKAEDTEVTPMELYRKAQALMKEGKREKGYQAAMEAKQKFIEYNQRLAWMLIESIELDNCRIDVHVNMGPAERNPPEMGLYRPLSFRIWAKDNSTILDILDFEITTMDGKPLTAALGQMEGRNHSNYGTMPTDTSYQDILDKVIKWVDGKYE